MKFAIGDLRSAIHAIRHDSCSARAGYYRGREKIGGGSGLSQLHYTHLHRRTGDVAA
jgi:hypothetical protein